MDDVPLRLRLLTREVDRLRKKLRHEVERARAARHVAETLRSTPAEGDGRTQKGGT